VRPAVAALVHQVPSCTSAVTNWRWLRRVWYRYQPHPSFRGVKPRACRYTPPELDWSSLTAPRWALGALWCNWRRGRFSAGICLFLSAKKSGTCPAAVARR